ncbi:MAG: hypothetical protein WBA41_07080 [Rivularia sp. (in: cyanobacteria)]
MMEALTAAYAHVAEPSENALQARVPCNETNETNAQLPITNAHLQQPEKSIKLSATFPNCDPEYKRKASL